MTRLARALHSSNLRDPADRITDADQLKAAGMAAGPVEERRIGGLGVLIVEAIEGAAGEGSHDVARVKDLEAELAVRIARWAARARLAVPNRLVAVHLVRELLLDKCPTCHGNGILPIVVHEVSDRLSEAECPTCFGSGRARINYHARAVAAGAQKYETWVNDFYDFVLNKLALAEMVARRAMSRRLRD